jgi:two-component system, OmpR family, alkaline phosphatase synthesis response regulator PhoP
VTPVLRVLVSEDEQDIRDVVRLKLEGAGFQVTAVEDGADALTRALNDPPDLVLLDVMTPGMNGLEVCEALRGTPATASVPIIMLTAEADERDVAAGLLAGATAYVTKPFSLRELLAQVRTVLAA